MLLVRTIRREQLVGIPNIPTKLPQKKHVNIKNFDIRNFGLGLAPIRSG